MGGGSHMVRLYVSIKALFNRSLFMPKFIDRLGQKFGRLSVVESAGRDRNKKVLWKCLCDCGSSEDIIVIGDDLKRGHTQSCGCLKLEKIKEQIVLRQKQIMSAYNFR
jgi:hypothetical protein